MAEEETQFDPLVCMDCGQRFERAAALGSHRRWSHGGKKGPKVGPAKQLVSDLSAGSGTIELEPDPEPGKLLAKFYGPVAMSLLGQMGDELGVKAGTDGAIEVYDIS